MNIAVIPARGGSKRIPRKNIKMFYGKPIIAWSIETAQKSLCFDKIIVSTDDEEIATIAQKYGAEIPFFRPSSLSDDFTPTIPVIKHAIEWFINDGKLIDYACCIYATAPFVAIEDIKKGYQTIRNNDANYVFPVAKYPFPIQRALRINDSGYTEMYYPDHFNTRSQDLEESYHDAGQFYWGKSSAWVGEKPIFSSSAIPLLLPNSRVQDIDTQDDWNKAEVMFDIYKKSMNES